MLIKFLRDCVAPQQWTKTFCECCGPEQMGYEDVNFFKDQEEDPEVYDHKIDLSGLEYKVDYEISQYP